MLFHVPAPVGRSPSSFTDPHPPGLGLRQNRYSVAKCQKDCDLTVNADTTPGILTVPKLLFGGVPLGFHVRGTPHACALRWGVGLYLVEPLCMMTIQGASGRSPWAVLPVLRSPAPCGSVSQTGSRILPPPNLRDTTFGTLCVHENTPIYVGDFSSHLVINYFQLSSC